MLDDLDEYCAEALTAHGCPSVSVAVVSDDDLLLARAYGLASVAGRRPATPSTVYGLASATKPFTALAVALAADRGLLDLDAPVPGFPSAGPTPRQLLQHRGGLPAFYNFHYGDGPLPIDLARYRRQVREPGSGFEYSNLGYQELGRLLEAVTGEELGAHLRSGIAEPLGLTSFGFGPTYSGPAPVADRHTPDGRVYPACRNGHPAAGDGWATAADLARFARRSARLLRPATAAALVEAPPIGDGRLGYGFGRVVQSDRSGPVVTSHGGGMGGVAAMMIDLPTRGLSVAVLANSTDKSARDAVVRHLMAELAPEFDPGHLAPGSEPPLPHPLPAGAWTGAVTTPDGELPLRLRVLTDGQVELALADAAPVTAPAVASRDWDLRLSARLQLPTADALLNSPDLALELRLADSRLTGRAFAFKNGDREGFLGPFLPHPCTLRPTGDGPTAQPPS